MLTAEQHQRFADALKRLGGNTEIFRRMAEFAVNDVPRLIEATESHLAAGRLTEAAETAHGLKGLLLTFETGAPVEQLEEMIQAAGAGDADHARSQWDNSREDIHHLMHEVADICN